MYNFPLAQESNRKKRTSVTNKSKSRRAKSEKGWNAKPQPKHPNHERQKKAFTNLLNKIRTSFNWTRRAEEVRVVVKECWTRDTTKATLKHNTRVSHCQGRSAASSYTNGNESTVQVSCFIFAGAEEVLQGWPLVESLIEKSSHWLLEDTVRWKMLRMQRPRLILSFFSPLFLGYFDFSSSLRGCGGWGRGFGRCTVHAFGFLQFATSQGCWIRFCVTYLGCAGEWVFYNWMR